MRTKRTVLVFLMWAIALTPAFSLPSRTNTQSAQRPVEMADILAWKRINSPSLSQNGQWFAYRVSPAEGDTEVIIRQTRGSKELRFPIGEATGGDVAFSPDAKFVAFSVHPTLRENRRARTARQTLYNKVALLDLATEKKVEFEKVRRFAFSGEKGGWLAMHRYGEGPAAGAAPAGGPPAQGPRQGGPGAAAGGAASERATGTDLILYELATGNQLHLGNVSEFTFSRSGDWLVWIVDTQEKSGNGIQARNMNTGAIVPLESDKANYRGLSWNEKGDGLTSLKGVEDRAFEDRLYSVVAFSQFNASAPQKIVYDPRNDTNFPKGMTISPNRPPMWTEDFSALLFGIHEPRKRTTPVRPGGNTEGQQGQPGEGNEGQRPAGPPAARRDEPEKPDLVLWHWKDSRLQSQQQVEESRDRNFSYLSIYHVADKKFVRLADNEVEQISVSPSQKWALGSDNDPYELTGNLDGRRYQDVYAVDLKTGARKPILKKARWAYGLSPDGSHLLYYEDGNFMTYDIASGQSYNISKQAPTSFINDEDDHNIVKPPTRQMGWTKDSKYVLLTDNWDIWQVPAHGGQAVNLTVNGKRDRIRYGARLRIDPDERGLGTDLSKPFYLSAISQATKKTGIGRIDPGQPGPKMLLWDDAGFGGVMKAKNADTFLYTRETPRDYPDFYVTDASFKDGQKITTANPQQQNFLWTAGSKLINYTSPFGHKLQAAIYLPANYEPGKSYPTIVYMYEKLTDGLNRYTQPSANGFNKSVYTSNGYAVLEPDIVFKVNDPGVASSGCIQAALKAAIETGIVDKDRVGIHGHSWGGYQTSFIVTQTNAFKAAVAGAPLTDMMSMYSLIYANSGGGNMSIFESSQGRFTSGPWESAEALEAYRRNSPVAFAKNVTTPLIILHNDKDGAVDFTQGVEYYSTLRRMQKPVVMLQYKGENHGLRVPANQRDYTVRMKEFFDHHLKGKPAPKWWTDGVPHLKMKDHLDERTKDAKDISSSFNK
jgi:dipeptidyl aminopeptidase/acylaminoacyl peptidase